MRVLIKIAALVLIVSLLVGVTVAGQEPPGHEAKEALTEAERLVRSSAEEGKARADLERMKLEAQRAAVLRFTDAGRAGGLGQAAFGRERVPLVVLSRAAAAEELAEGVEDMNVLSRILDKTLERELGDDYPAPMAPRRDYTSVYRSTRERSYAGVQGIYLQDYGALLVASVRFPLAAPAKAEERETPEEAETMWEKTRREMYERKLTSPTKATGEAEYDAEKADKLTRTILETLKNASNMRKLKPDEAIVVAVRGGAVPIVLEVDPVSGRWMTPRQTILVVRVKKSDVDAFAEGELRYEQFRESAEVLAYSVPVPAPTASLPTARTPRTTPSAGVPWIRTPVLPPPSGR